MPKRPIFKSVELGPSERVLRELERKIAEAPRKAHKTAARVLRRQLQRGKSAASRDIRAHVNLKKKKVDERIRTEIFLSPPLTGTLKVRDRRIELIEFLTPNQIANAHRRQRARSRRSKGVRVKAYKQRPAKVYPGTFVERGTKSGKWHVFKRAGESQYPIFIRYGPRLTELFEKRLARFRRDQNLQMERELLRLFAADVDIT